MPMFIRGCSKRANFMAEWVQLVEPEPCGRCGVMQAVGTMVRQSVSSLTGATKRRCQDCINAFVPPDVQPRQQSVRLLDPAVVSQDLKSRMTHIGSLAVQFR